jgi:hypothetical protein
MRAITRRRDVSVRNPLDGRSFGGGGNIASVGDQHFDFRQCALVAYTELSLEPVTITASLATNVIPDLSASPWPRYGAACAFGNAAETERCPQMSNGLS